MQNTRGKRGGGGVRVLAIYLYIIQRFVELNSQSFTGNRNGNEPLEISASSRGNLLINSCRALMRSLSLTLSLSLSSIMQGTNSVLSLLRKVSVYGLQRSIESSNDKNDVGQCEWCLLRQLTQLLCWITVHTPCPHTHVQCSPFDPARHHVIQLLCRNLLCVQAPKRASLSSWVMKAFKHPQHLDWHLLPSPPLPPPSPSFACSSSALLWLCVGGALTWHSQSAAAPATKAGYSLSLSHSLLSPG